MEHSEDIDCSRESTEAITPFLTIVDVDTTFLSGVQFEPSWAVQFPPDTFPGVTSTPIVTL